MAFYKFMKKIKIKIHSEKLFSYVAMFSMVANVLSPFAAVLPSTAYAEGSSTTETTQQVEEESKEEVKPEEEAPAEEPEGTVEQIEEQSTEKESTEETYKEENTEPKVAVESSNEISEGTFTIDPVEDSITETEVAEVITPAEPVVEEPAMVEEQTGDILPDGVSDYRPEIEIEEGEAIEVQEVVDPVSTETSSTGPEVVITEPSETEPAVTVEPITPTETEETPKEVIKEYETLADGAEVKDSTKEDWNIDGEKTETKEVVKIGVKYVFPLEEDVTLTFTKLPKEDSDRSTLIIERVKVSDLDLPEDFKTDAEYAFDITTPDMDDGEFEYNLTLPKPEGVDAEVAYIEKSINEAKDEVKSEDVKKVEEDKIDQDGGSIKVESLDHLTLFIPLGGVVLSVSGSFDGATQVTVEPGTAIEVDITVERSDGWDWWSNDVENDWKATSWKINDGSWNCENHSDHTWGNGTDTGSFNITAPLAEGTYDVSFRAHRSNSCEDTGVSNTFTLTNGIKVESYSAPSPTLHYNVNDDYVLTSVSGVWTDVNGGSEVTGEGTNEVRWGRSAEYGKKSGLRFDGSDQQSFNEGSSFYLGALTHFNWPITNASSGATLKITLHFSKPGISPDPDFSYDFNIEETSNSYGHCLSWQQSSTPCDDKITFPSSYGEKSFTIGDKLYTLKILGFVNSYPGGSPVSQFITEEQKNNTAYLVGTLSSVLVPAPQITLVEKAINGNDADSSPGDSLYVGDAVTFTYQVQNTGNVDLTNIVIHDNDSSLSVTCPSTSLTFGSSMTCTATSTVKLGNYHNTAYVTAKHGSQSLRSSDEEGYYVGVNRIICGDGIKDVSEACDNGPDNGDVCTAPYDGDCNYCGVSCEIITVRGPYCGDGTKNGSEQCDGLDLGNLPSSDFSCTKKCELNLIQDKVTICHADASGHKPYTINEPNKSADVNGHDGHNGPIWFLGITGDWGDIIPPFYYVGGYYVGKNWTPEGEAIWRNGCDVPPYCGDGVINQPTEQCDDANSVNNDGCSATCQLETGTITIIKDAQPDDSQTFNFTYESNPYAIGNFSLTDNGGGNEKISFASIPVGSYSWTEDLVTDWRLDSIACDDSNSVGDLSARRVDVVLDANEHVTCIFTNVLKTGTISGVKFEDINGNRVQDSNEHGLSGWTIYIDSNKNNQLDAGEPTQVTDVNGNFVFNGLTPGKYWVKEINQTGWSQTVPAGLYQEVDLKADENESIYFGNQRNPVTINAYKVVCDNESYLPNYGTGGPDITSTTAQNWVSNSNGHCKLEPNWKFQWSFDGVDNPGDNITSEAGTGWNTFGPTDGDGFAQIKIYQLDTPKLWFREVLQDGYIPFTYGAHPDNSDNVSAEFYCNDDVFNYDNWEWIDNPQYGNTYYCVAWNTLKKGSLEVTKTVNWTEIIPDVSKTFEVCITGPSYTSGNCKTIDYDGGTLTWNDLLLGDYTITESDLGAHWSVVGSGSVVSVSDSSTTHQITNTYIPYCGDGVKNGAEQCDGRSGVNEDMEFCTSQCKLVPVYDGNHECPKGTIEKYITGITLGSQSSSLQTLNLSGGRSYLLKAFGTYQYGSGSTRKADPAYGSEDNFATWRPDIGIWGVNNRGVTSILGNLGRGMGVIEWDNDKNIDEDHIYEKLIKPESDLEAKFVISDWYSNWYGNSCDNQGCMTDNNGSLNVDLYECVEPSSIQGKKFKDVNGNGIRDSGDTYLDGWTVNLYQQKEGWSLVKSMITGNDLTEAGSVDQGQYRFVNLLPGKYLVCEELKSGWVQTAPVEGTSYNGTTCYEVDLAAGKGETGKVFGNFELGKVQGMKFNDLDGDGNSHETGEEYLNGWTIRLYKDWAEPVEVITSNTGTLGQYKFENLKPGTYQVCEVLQQGWVQTWPSAGDIPVGDNGVTHPNYGTAVINSSSALDEGANCWQTVVSASGQFNQLLRFGNSNLGSIHGMKYIDTSGDGNFDSGTDWGASGWTINLYKLVNSTYVLASSVSTDSNGYYSFANLEQGTYKLEEVQQSGYQVINPSAGIYEGIILNPGDNLTNYNFGNFQNGSVYGCKYNDLDGDGVRNREIEPQMAGVTMNLYDSSWNLVASTATSEGSGYGNNYSFSNLLGKGTYYVCEVMWKGWAQTEPNAENGVLNVSPNAENEGSYCRKIENNYSGGGYASQRFGNVFVNPKLQISKSNDASSAKKIGDIVTFTIKVKVLDFKLDNVTVLDLLPKGFIFQDEDWGVTSSNPLFSFTGDPHYASPGTWKLGSLQKDEEVTITYEAKVGSDVDPGVYKDLAWTSGDDILGSNVLGLAQDGKVNDYFVGTEVEVTKDKDSTKDTVDVKETEEEEEKEEVLGASDVRLPATGASTAILDVVLIAGLVGALLMIIGGIGKMLKAKKKKDKNSRLKKALLTMLMLSFSLILTSKVYAESDSKLVARIEDPKSPAISSFSLSFVVLDANETPRSIEAQCWKKGPLDLDFVKFADPSVDGVGGNTNNCLVDNSVLTKSGTYVFKVKVKADSGDWQDSINTAAVVFDNDGPDKPKYIEKDKKSDCKYEITLKTADDDQTSYIEVYKDDDKEMNLHSGNLIKTKTIGPDEKYEFTYEVYSSDCAKTWYFAVIAFDDSGNASDPRAEEVVTKVTVTKTTKTEEVLGALEVPGGANLSQEGEGANKEVPTETSEESKGAVLGEKTQEQGFVLRVVKSLWFWLIIVLLVYIIVRVVKKKQNKKKR